MLACVERQAMIRSGHGQLVAFLSIVLLGTASSALADGTHQHDTPEALPCGPTAVAIAFRLLDLPVRNYELDTLADRDGVSTLQQLRDYAASKGLYARAFSLTPDGLTRLNAVAILPVGLDTADSVGHFLVFGGLSTEGQPVILDPLLATSVVGYRPYDAALESWRGQALVVLKGAPPFWLDPAWWMRRFAYAAFLWVLLPMAILITPAWIAKKLSKSAAPALSSSGPALPASS
jgi:ABC-type bacteriocin/lantibiotic exporter with double-glycine peptidase domain